MESATVVINTAEACERLGGINRSTLKRWVDDGKVVAFRKLPGETGAYLFDAAEIERVAAAEKASA
jgi:predicted site-specific integrase-resolvase